MPTKTQKIAIIGGGPAGAYLAYLLAKKGIKPTIYDNSHPREKPCGGGISTFTIERFPILNEISEPKAPDNKIEILTSKGTSIMTTGQKNSWALSRLHFDKFLLDKAIENGAKLIKERVIDVKQKNKKWEILTNNKKRYNANIIVGADGVDSIVRKKIIGPIPKQNLGVCYGCFAKSNKKESTRLLFLKDIPGYAWCFPRHDHLSIGVGLLDYSDSKKIKPVLNKFISNYYPHVEITTRWGAKIPNIKKINFYKLPCSGDNWILIGDAAGHVDTITGEGISYALLSAESASKAIINKDINSFDDLWRKEYAEQLMESCKLRNIMYGLDFLDFSVKIAATSDTLSSLLYRLLNSEQSYYEFIRQLFVDSPKIIKEIFLKTVR